MQAYGALHLRALCEDDRAKRARCLSAQGLWLQVLYSNRALAYLRLDQPELALQDCQQALHLGWNAKAAYRHGQAAIALGHYREASQSFQVHAGLCFESWHSRRHCLILCLI